MLLYCRHRLCIQSKGKVLRWYPIERKGSPLVSIAAIMIQKEDEKQNCNLANRVALQEKMSYLVQFLRYWYLGES